jgi:error-prone DNA polymerase
LHDLSEVLASIGDRDAAFPLPLGRGDELHRGSPSPDSRDLPPRGMTPRDSYAPDHDIDTIKVRTRDFR